jgi:hypothetical protein
LGKIIDLAHNINFDEIVRTKGVGYKPDFQIFTAGIESDRTIKNRVNMIGSSTQQDMQGDTMSLLALNDMTKAAENLTIWLNHDYSLPDSMFGSIVGTPAIMHQDGIADLHLAVDVEMDNPAAARTKQYIDKGRRLGCSIGCMVTKYEVPTEEDGDDWQSKGIIVHGVYVVEYSVVGIPANQRSWVENAIRGVFTRTLDPHLAPAMKALWPTTYKEVLKEMPADKKKDIESMPNRPKADTRLNWHAASKTFTLNSEGKEKRLHPDQVKALFRGEAVEVSEVSTEPEIVTPEDIVDMSKSEDDILTKAGVNEIGEPETDERHTHVDGTSSLPDADNDKDDQIEAPNAAEIEALKTEPSMDSVIEVLDEAEPEVTKEVEPEAEKEFEVPAHITTLLQSYNALGLALGFPEITVEMYAKAQHPVMSKSDELAPEASNSLQLMHDMICGMSKSITCNGTVSPQEAPAPVSAYNGLDPDMIKKLTSSIDKHHDATVNMASFSKMADDMRAVIVKEFEVAKLELGTLSAEISNTQRTILELKNMPLGNPVGHNRTIHPEDSVVTHKQLLDIQDGKAKSADMIAVDSLKEALALTEIRTETVGTDMYMKYRVWPAGVGGQVGKGVRPELTANHFMYMKFEDVQAYRAGQAAKVPYMDNQKA